MVYVNEKGKLEVSREGKVLSVMPPGNRKLIRIIVNLQFNTSSEFERNLVLTFHF